MYFRGRGRIGRGRYWLYGVAAFLAFYFMLGFVVGLLGYTLSEDHARLSVMVLAWPLGAVQLKRWHDRGKGSVWLLVNLVPLVGPLWVFVELALLPGQPGDNRYGPAPGKKASTSQTAQL